MLPGKGTYGAPHYTPVDVPAQSSLRNEARQRLKLAVGFALLALAAVTLLAASSSTTTPIEASTHAVKTQQVASAKSAAHQQKLWEGLPTQTLQDAPAEDAPAEDAAADDAAPTEDATEEAPAEDAAPADTPSKVAPADEEEKKKKAEEEEGIAADFVPHLDKIRFPSSWDNFRVIFGMHLDWTIFIIFLGILCYLWINFVAPKLPKEEQDESMDEIPEDESILRFECFAGEEIAFHQRSAVSSSWWQLLCCGCGNSVWSLAVTDKRIVATKRESTAFGTCVLTDTKESWPIENVSKVSIITGEFWGHSVPALWEMAYKYLLIALLFDFFHAFVKENIKDVLGSAATDPMGITIIAATNIFLYVLCNILFLLAVIYSFAVMALCLFPHSLVKVYMTRDMHEEGGPVQGFGAWCCGKGNSRPMESFTFQTKVSEVVYNSIMRARLGLPPAKKK